MTFQDYISYFNEIINSPLPAAPYDDAFYMSYTKLNDTRMRRWLKTAHLNSELKALVNSIERPMKWIVITEPWCGDAAHIVPFIELISKENGLITVDYELRDAEPHRISEYLTNGGKAIPIVIMKDDNDTELAVWGPRPKEAQELHTKLKEEKADFDTLINEMQLWYNGDKGQQIQEELYAVLKKIAQ